MAAHDLPDLTRRVDAFLGLLVEGERNGPITGGINEKVYQALAGATPETDTGLIWKWGRAARAAGAHDSPEVGRLADALSHPDTATRVAACYAAGGARGEPAATLFRAGVEVVRGVLAGRTGNELAAAAELYQEAFALDPVAAAAVVGHAAAWLTGSPAGPAPRAESLILLSRGTAPCVWFRVGPAAVGCPAPIPDPVRLGVIGLDATFLASVRTAWECVSAGGKRPARPGLCWWLDRPPPLVAVEGDSGGVSAAAAFRAARDGAALRPWVVASAALADRSGRLSSVSRPEEKLDHAKRARCRRVVFEARQATDLLRSGRAAGAQVVGAATFEDAWRHLRRRWSPVVVGAGVVLALLAVVLVVVASWPRHAPRATPTEPRLSISRLDLVVRRWDRKESDGKISLLSQEHRVGLDGEYDPRVQRTRRVAEYFVRRVDLDDKYGPLRLDKGSKTTSDKFYLDGQFTRPTAWWVVCLEPDGEPGLVHQSTAVSAALRAPPYRADDEKQLFYMAGRPKPPGVCLLVFLVGAVAGDRKGEIESALTGLGRPDSALPPEGYVVRGETSEEAASTAADVGYLDRLRARIPPGLTLVGPQVYFKTVN